MPAAYSAPVLEFLKQDEDLIIGRLSTLAGRPQTELAAEQLNAWRQEITILRSALEPHLSCHLLLEYPIPRRGKRIDAVILTRTLIFVLEFKCGGRDYNRDARNQVEDYCLDLRDFHRQSVHRTLVPILVATLAPDRFAENGEVVDHVAPLYFANSKTLGKVVAEALSKHVSANPDPIDPGCWDNGDYAPTPTILEAARALYEGQNVREISRCHAGAENLTKTSAAVMQAVERARDANFKLICFVTGVPGSGKTLAGLNIVHSRELHKGSLGVFLSGNAPLVRVLSEALARDHSRRTVQSIAESRRKVSAFVQNVHRFIDAHFKTSTPPPDRVVVFDEAQRAWNQEQSERKFGRDRSEPSTMLDIMDRHQGWGVIVALIGNGQEINTGEAGLAEWGRALTERFKHWNVLVSPHALNHDSAQGSDLLFEAESSTDYVHQDEALHLEVPLRSYKAEAVSQFVGYLLSQQPEKAKSMLSRCSDFPVRMTRDLDVARNWLRRHQRGTRRIGLIASSGARRLRAYGLDVRQELDVENWFLNDSSDVRSSYYLETPATEFGIQGLELDWTGVCWDIDLEPFDGRWRVRAFKGSHWQTVRDRTRQQYVINKYRVLLTRSREGTIIWVPRGDVSDWTRPTSSYESVAEYLKSCGIPEI